MPVIGEGPCRASANVGVMGTLVVGAFDGGVLSGTSVHATAELTVRTDMAFENVVAQKSSLRLLLILPMSTSAEVMVIAGWGLGTVALALSVMVLISVSQFCPNQ